MNLLLKGNYLRNFFVGIISLITVGCGSGGSDVLTGQFVDDPVAGLHYSTPTFSGETNANGEFQYRPGEMVSFYVGDILVGEAPGAVTITPFDLAGMDVPNTALEIRREANRANNNARKEGTLLEVAANIAVFLQTLDGDENPNDRIQIPDELHFLASGMSLDFNQRMRDFRDDYSFRKLLASGRSAGLWGGKRAVRNTAYALDTLYEGLGLTPDIKALSMIKSNNYSAIITYDANGNRTREEDFDGNGNSIRISTTTYDFNDNRTRQEFDFGGDGTPDQIYTYTYDVNGNLTKFEFDSSDGTPDYIFTYTYDTNGNKIRGEIDANGDGVTDSITTFTYDANGDITREETDFGGDSPLQYIVTYTYDFNGNLIKKEYDFDGGGTPDSTLTYTYTTNGTLTKEEKDLNGNGMPDNIITYIYDSNDNLIKTEYDNNGDGMPDNAFTYTYDANGNVTKFEFDTNGDGIQDSVTTSTYDANGNLIKTESDLGVFGPADSIYTYTYTYDTVNRWAALLNN